MATHCAECKSKLNKKDRELGACLCDSCASKIDRMFGELDGDMRLKVADTMSKIAGGEPITKLPKLSHGAEGAFLPIEYVGGPLDGHKEIMRASHYSVATWIAYEIDHPDLRAVYKRDGAVYRYERTMKLEEVRRKYGDLRDFSNG